MASFFIHEDHKTFIRKKKTVKILQPATSRIPQQKSNIGLKEQTFPKKRVPLRPTNNQVSKVRLENNKKAITQNGSQVMIYKNPIQIGDHPLKVNKPLNKLETIQEISKVGKEDDKENYSKESGDKNICFSLDCFYTITQEYHDDIQKYLLQSEQNVKRLKPSYMLKQPEITYKMRSILVDWLSAVSEEYSLQSQTFHLAVSYIDCFLSRMAVIKSKFQLVGTAAIMLAAKYEEIYPPETKEWVYLTADSYTVKQLLRMEQLILKVLRFNLAQPTAYTFIAHVCVIFKLPRKTMFLALYFSELALLEGDDYLKFIPSKLAFAAVALARYTLKEQDVWPNELESYTGYSLKTLSSLIKRQHKSFTDSPTRDQQAVQDKFKTAKYERVSLCKPRIFDLV